MNSPSSNPSIWAPIDEEIALSSDWDDTQFRSKLLACKFRAATPPMDYSSAQATIEIEDSRGSKTDPRPTPTKKDREKDSISRRRLFDSKQLAVSAAFQAASPPLLPAFTQFPRKPLQKINGGFDRNAALVPTSQPSLSMLQGAPFFSPLFPPPLFQPPLMPHFLPMPQLQIAPMRMVPPSVVVGLPPNTMLVPADSTETSNLFRLVQMDQSSAPPSLSSEMLVRSNSPAAVPSGPAKIACLVEFKRGRTLQYESSLNLTPGEYVIVGGDRGEDLGMVVKSWTSESNITNNNFSFGQASSPSAVQYDDFGNPVPNNEQSMGYVVRRAAAKEVQYLHTVQTELEKKCVEVCQQKVADHGLIMDVVDAEYQFDRKKLTFYYESSERQDFRDLVRELYKAYRARIWMSKASSK